MHYLHLMHLVQCSWCSKQHFSAAALAAFVAALICFQKPEFICVHGGDEVSAVDTLKYSYPPTHADIPPEVRTGHHEAVGIFYNHRGMRLDRNNPIQPRVSVAKLNPHLLEFLQRGANGCHFLDGGLLFPLYLFKGVSQIVQTTDAFTMRCLDDLDLFDGDLDGWFIIVMLTISIGAGAVAGRRRGCFGHGGAPFW